MTSTAQQAERLIDRGVPALAGLDADGFRDLLIGLEPPQADVGAGDAGSADSPVLVVHPDLVGARELAGLLELGGKEGFVVEDLVDLEDFGPRPGLTVPPGPPYLLHGVDRGDDLRNVTPDEALPRLTAAGRSPLTVSEGISWLLQQPDRLEPNHCFMCIGSRRPQARGREGLDARTPALWISGGTGRDGRARRGAPKLGWCWAGNRHTWLGIASATHRSG